MQNLVLLHSTCFHIFLFFSSSFRRLFARSPSAFFRATGKTVTNSSTVSVREFPKISATFNFYTCPPHVFARRDISAPHLRTAPPPPEVETSTLRRTKVRLTKSRKPHLCLVQEGNACIKEGNTHVNGPGRNASVRTHWYKLKTVENHANSFAFPATSLNRY